MHNNDSSFHKILNNKKPTIAVLVGSMTSSYQEGIMRGASDAAKENGYNVVGFSGGPFKSPDPLAQSRETIFDLVDNNIFDGIIIPVSSHCRYFTDTETQSFVDQFSNIPLVNIGSEIDGCINVVTDYEVGIEEVIDHLVNKHGYRHIAFMRGPAHHASSERRMNIYKNALKSHGIQVDEQLIICCDLRYNAAKIAVTELLDVRKVNCEAIISVNDHLALGIIDDLIERNISVPEDIAVIGSMNITEGLFSTPSLTTVEEPLYELGKKSMLALVNTVNGHRPCNTIHIPTKLIKRQSCGCEHTLPVIKETIPSHHNPSIVSKKDIMNYLELACMEQLNEYKCPINLPKLHLIIEAYLKALETGENDYFIISIKDVLDKVLKTDEIFPWLGILSILQNFIFQYYESHKEKTYIGDLHSHILALKYEIEKNAIIFQSFETDFYINFFREIINNLNSSFDLQAVKTYALKILDLNDLYINIYNKGTHNKYATNVMSVRNKSFIEIEETNKSFESKQLIPYGVNPYNQRYTLMVFPLSFRKKPLGYIILDLTKRKGSAYENMQAIISTALKNELQIQELKEAEERFSDIAHSTSDWLWETDIDHNYIYCSSSVKDVIGHSDHNLIGKKINVFSVSEHDLYYENLENHETLNNIETWQKHTNGNLVCLLISATPIMKDDVFIGYRGVYKDITAQKLQEEKIKNLAYYDILTGLPNRTNFQESLKKTATYAKNNNGKFALMFLDLDHFKYINDTMGHATGDLLLIKVAKLLKKSIRTGDSLARLGGDEFTIILPKIEHEKEIIKVADRILKNLSKPTNLNGKEYYIKVSIGIAMYPMDGISISNILKNADTAMYRAKALGRNRYVFYDKEIEKINTNRFKYEEILRDAIINDHFTIHYQPQVDTCSGKVSGLEALVRIENQEDGLIAPYHFISLAEELDLISTVDEIVFEGVCKQYKSWSQAGYKHTKISINLSTAQLGDLQLVDKYMAFINKYQVDPNDIQLEITENTLIENEDNALSLLTQFRAQGIKIALDDFGTGFSSLQCIYLYPIDIIKIDRIFISDILTNKKNQAIIQAIIGLANSLNLQVVVEGVESKEQLDYVKTLDCNKIQGFYFSQPLAIEAIETMLHDSFTFFH